MSYIFGIGFVVIAVFAICEAIIQFVERESTGWFLFFLALGLGWAGIERIVEALA